MLPKYVSHKEVEAGKIVGVRAYAGQTRDIVAEVVVSVDGVEYVIEVPVDFNARGTPKIGDWLIRYKDGYLSWSPAEAFETGYTRMT